MEKINLINPDIQKYLMCLKCKLVIENPYELECCGSLFCYNCVKFDNISKRCLKCNKKSEYRQNSFVKRILNQMQLNCGFNCGKKFSSIEIRSHMKNCEMREYVCNICENKGISSNFIGDKKGFIAHLLEIHEADILDFNDNYNEFKSIGANKIAKAFSLYEEAKEMHPYNSGFSNYVERRPMDLVSRSLRGVSEERDESRSFEGYSGEEW